MSPELIKKAKVDPVAFGDMYDLLFPEVYKYIFLRVKTREMAEDMNSLVWEKILENIRAFHSDHPVVFRAWVFTIARNTLYEYYRSKHSELIHIEDYDPVDPVATEEIVQAAEMNEFLFNLVCGLSPIEREILSLKFFSDFKNKEIAGILKLPEKTVAAYLSRALAILKKRADGRL